jgi:uncharacterized Zn finger protein
MKPIRTFLTEEQIEDLATRSHFRFGKQIAEAGDVTIELVNTFNVVAKVQHKEGEGRTVELMSTPKGFRFRCTCSAKKNFFCQHCVAVALAQIAKL